MLAAGWSFPVSAKAPLLTMRRNRNQIEGKCEKIKDSRTKSLSAFDELDSEAANWRIFIVHEILKHNLLQPVLLKAAQFVCA